MAQKTFMRSLQTAIKQSQTLAAPRPHTPFVLQSFRASVSAPSVSSQFKLQRRCYSEEPAKKAEETPAAAENKATNTADDAVKKELEAKKAEVQDLTDRVMRTVADYRNLQEQTKREVQAAKDFALQRFAKDLLESMDNLDRALTTVPADKLTDDNKDLVNLHSGLKMTESILLQTLKRHGLERFDPAETADKFDPNKMEATFQAPQPGKEDGTVFFTQSKGFALNGRVLRAAKVGVVRNA